VSFANPLPWWALAPVIALAALVAWQAYRHFSAPAGRRITLSLLRLTTLLLLIVFLMRPVARIEQDGNPDAVVPILVDTSRSMGIHDTASGRRIDRARELLLDLLPTLEPHFQVEVLAFGEGTAAADPSHLAATARRSDLTSALADLHERYQGRPVAGIVLLSDGGDTSGIAGDEGGTTPGNSAPVYAIGIGSETAGRDREVLSVTAADSVLDDSRLDLAVSAVSHGHGVEPIELRLLENGRPVEVRRSSPASAGVPVREVFQVSPRPGAPTVYTVEIPAAAGELVPENNSRSALVQTPARARRILLVEGAPGFEHSFMKRALAADRGLEIDSAVRKGRNEQGSDTFYIQASRSRSDALRSGFPERREDLFAYDALVFGNIDGNQITRAQLEATRAFVAERGGGLLVLGARSFMKDGLGETPLEEVLPLHLAGRGGSVLPASSGRGLNRVTVTEVGAAHPVMQLGAGAANSRARWESVPALASTVHLGGPRPGASVLAVTAGPGGAPRALIAVQRFGEGRSMIFTGEAAWRWRMMLPSTDRSYDTFWRQAVRWLALAASDPVSVVMPAGGSPGETLPLSILVRDAAFQPLRDAMVDLQVTTPEGRIEKLSAAPGSTAADEAAGRFLGRFRPEQPGVYRVNAVASRAGSQVGAASASVLVGGADLEMADPRLNHQLLQRLALASGGRTIDADAGGELLQALRASVPASTHAVRRDLWHNAWSLAAIVLLLGVEWILRRKWGLR
jgi:uncharacterized membrane protein